MAVFVDGANMFYAQREARWHIDFRRTLDHFAFSRGYDLFSAFYFTGAPPVDEPEEVRKYRRFRNALINIGYKVIDKEVKTISDRESGLIIQKANLDVEITMYALLTVNNYDEAVFMSGDSDFAPLYSHLRATGKSVVCAARRQSAPIEVVNAVTRFVDLDSIRQAIEKSGDR
ncbi:MAG: NYN domain-containing protein [Chloroflexi bacterium]|nr:NYN domain-containing protein [Chloroflexota bacterium]